MLGRFYRVPWRRGGACGPVFLAGCLLTADSLACEPEAALLGDRVEAVTAALRDPGAPGSLRSVVELGTDSRYYVMVRGWLLQQLAGDRSVLAAGGSQPRPDLETRIEFLERAIRAIDLE